MREIEVSGRAVLACGSCGEKTVLLGETSDWSREGRSTFACGGCGRELGLADSVAEADLAATGANPGPR